MPPPTVDYDTDDDGLIEVSDLTQLNAIRWDLDGKGSSVSPGYVDAFPYAQYGMGCPGSCEGYELMMALDFDTNRNGDADRGDLYWNDGAGWLPIGGEDGPFVATFDGNGNTLANLYINRDSDFIGLFGLAGYQSSIKRIGLDSVDVFGLESVGSLVGLSQGDIAAAHATGTVSGGSFNVGGLVGANVGTVSASYAEVGVTGGTDNAGGLVGQNAPGAQISTSYAGGNVSSMGGRVGGLVGVSNGGGIIVACYAIGSVSGGRFVGGLVGYSWYTTILDSYATGSAASVIFPENAGGLVGKKEEGEIRNSYWDIQTSGLMESDGGIGKKTRELQIPNGSTGIYEQWRSEWWDFGTATQYPALKYGGHSLALQRQR